MQSALAIILFKTREIYIFCWWFAVKNGFSIFLLLSFLIMRHFHGHVTSNVTYTNVNKVFPWHFCNVLFYTDTSAKPPHDSIDTSEPYLRGYSKFLCSILGVMKTLLVNVCWSAVQSSDTSCSPISRRLMSDHCWLPRDCELGQYVNKCQVQTWGLEIK